MGGEVTQIIDRWRIDDEWWRKAVARLYFHIVLANGAVVTIFHDLVEDGWFLQTTAMPVEQPEPVEVLAPASTAVTEREVAMPRRAGAA